MLAHSGATCAHSQPSCMSEQAMLRASILRLFQLAAKPVPTSLDTAGVRALLCELNLAMEDSL